MNSNGYQQTRKPNFCIYFKQPKVGPGNHNYKLKTVFIFVILLGRVAAHYEALESDSEGFIPIETESSDTGKYKLMSISDYTSAFIDHL